MSRYKEFKTAGEAIEWMLGYSNPSSLMNYFPRKVSTQCGGPIHIDPIRPVSGTGIRGYVIPSGHNLEPQQAPFFTVEDEHGEIQKPIPLGPIATYLTEKMGYSVKESQECEDAVRKECAKLIILAFEDHLKKNH